MYTHKTTIVENSYTLYVEIDCDYHPPEFSREGLPTLPGRAHRAC
jgi:hypothetical protein